MDSKRSPGVAAVWVARNRFAVLDKTHQITIKDLSNKDSRKIEFTGPVNDIFYAGTGLLLLKNADNVQLYDIQQKRVMATAKVSKVFFPFLIIRTAKAFTLFGKMIGFLPYISYTP